MLATLPLLSQAVREPSALAGARRRMRQSAASTGRKLHWLAVPRHCPCCTSRPVLGARHS
eukprot:scaffold14095_cov116-Isochrysis_galbana.AAC.3